MLLRAMLMALLVSFLPSCCSWMTKTYDVEISTSAGLRGSSVEVNIIGVNSIDRQYWESLKVDEYFGSELQKSGDNIVMKFSQKEPAIQNLSDDALIWEKWAAKGVTHLYIVASIPGVISSETGSRDPRMVALPLDACRWDGNRIVLKIDTARVILLTSLLAAD
ncbi:MAG: hypothetical protein NE330_22405 [Lentisphaeraceae bacterium]|nr:hypothetical protein [Lentisphaeraceae bacterium]